MRSLLLSDRSAIGCATACSQRGRTHSRSGRGRALLRRELLNQHGQQAPVRLRRRSHQASPPGSRHHCHSPRHASLTNESDLGVWRHARVARDVRGLVQGGAVGPANQRAHNVGAVAVAVNGVTVRAVVPAARVTAGRVAPRDSVVRRVAGAGAAPSLRPTWARAQA